MRRLLKIPPTVPNAASQISFVTPDATGQTTHPDVLDFGNGNTWNGYRFWLCLTPYFHQDSTLENPCMYASTDGLTWVVPSGLSNPLAPYPGGGVYNSDPTMTYNPVTNKIYLYYRTTSTVDTYTRLESSDGINWTNSTVVITWPISNFYVSPQVHYDVDSATWIMWVLKHTTANAFVNALYLTSTDGLTWSAPTAIPFQPPLNFQPWHFNIKKYGGIFYGVLAAYPTGAAASSCRLFYFQAMDGQGRSFQCGAQPILKVSASGWDKNFLYQSCLRIVDGQWYMWYSGIGGVYAPGDWNIGVTTAPLNARQLKTGRRVVFGRTPLSSAETAGAVDTFTRADSTTSLGSTEVGAYTWTSLTGTYGILSNRAYGVSATNDGAAYIDLATADADTSFTVAAYGPSSFEVALFFRIVDANNLWRMIRSLGNILIQRKTTTFTTVVTVPTAFADGDVWRVVCVNNTIQCYINGIRIATVNSTVNITGTKFGIGQGTANSARRFDNFQSLPITLASSAVNITDTFTRADSTTTLDTTETGGKTWTAAVGTFGISSNQAYLSTTTNDGMAVIDAGIRDADTSITINNYGPTAFEAALYFRVVDSTNNWRMIRATGNILIQRKIANVYSTRATIPQTFAVGDVFRVVCTGSIIQAYLNGSLLTTLDDSTHQTATKFGFGTGTGNTTRRYDNFSCTGTLFPSVRAILGA